MKKITEATATEVATVEENTVRKKRMPRSCWCARTASNSPRISPVGTVKSRLSRARHALQRQLYDYAVEMGYVKRRKP